MDPPTGHAFELFQHFDGEKRARTASVEAQDAYAIEFWLPLPEEEEDDPLPQPAPPAEAPPARGASRFAPPPRVVEAEVVESLQPAEEVWVAGAAAEAVASNDAELQREGEVADAAAAAGWMQALEQRSWRNLKYKAAYVKS